MIVEVTVFKTSDGQVHETLQLAKARELFMGLSSLLDKGVDFCNRDSDEVVQWISENRDVVREFLDALEQTNGGAGT